MTHNISFEKTAQYLVLFILLTIPVVFGAVHPIIKGSYTFLIIVGLGGWLIFSLPLNHYFISLSRTTYIIIGVLLCYSILLSIPIPLPILKLLSPVRAESVEMVNQLAGTNQFFGTISYNPTSNFLAAVFLFSLFLLFISLSYLLRHDKKYIHLIIGVIVLVGTCEAIYGLLQVMKPSIGKLWLPLTANGAHGTIIYKNQYASLLNMCWPISLGAALLEIKKIRYFYKHRSYIRSQPVRIIQTLSSSFSVRAILLLFSSTVIMLAVLFSYSRGGIISMVFIFVFLCILLPAKKNRKFSLFLIFLLTLFFISSQIGTDQIIQGFSQIESSVWGRLYKIKMSLPVLKDHALTGIGLDSYSSISDVYIKFSSGTLLYDRVHNEFLELFVELGIPAAFLLFGFLFYKIIVSGNSLFKKISLHKKGAQTPSFITMGAFGALLGFMLHGVVDFGWRLPANAVYLAALSALVSNTLQIKR